MHQTNASPNAVVPIAEPTAAPLTLHEAASKAHDSSIFASLAESAHSICLGYFGPTVFAVGITLVRFPYKVVPVADVAIGVVAIIFSMFSCFLTWYACHRDWTEDELKASAGFKARIRRLCFQWPSFYEGARDLKLWYVRQHVFEDMAVAYIIAGLSAVYPQSIAGCTAMCALMFFVSVFHLVYLLLVKPYESKLEGWLAIVNAIIMVVIALLSTITLLNDTNTIETVLGVALLIANAFYFIQAIILCGVAFMAMLRDRNNQETEKKQSELTQGLLSVPEPLAPPPNPIQQGYQAQPMMAPAMQQAGGEQAVTNPLAQGARQV